MDGFWPYVFEDIFWMCLNTLQSVLPIYFLITYGVGRGSCLEESKNNQHICLKTRELIRVIWFAEIQCGVILVIISILKMGIAVSDNKKQ